MKTYKYCELTAIEVYKMVQRGDVIKKFPSGFWQGEEGQKNAAELTRYMIEEILDWDDAQVLSKLSAKTFREKGLGGMLSNMFGDSPYAAYNLAYPEKFKPWEFRQVSANFWNLDTGIAATRWLIETKLRWNDKEVADQLKWHIFTENGLGGMIQHVFDSSPFEAISSAYPGKFKAWEFAQTPKEYFNRENSLVAIKWMIEDKLKWDEEEIRRNLTADVFRENGLAGMLHCQFKNSPYDAINYAYPGSFKPWEFRKTQLNFWNEETAVTATRWMVEEKLMMSGDSLKNIARFHFTQYGLAGMLVTLYKGNHKNALRAAYPDADI